MKNIVTVSSPAGVNAFRRKHCTFKTVWSAVCNVPETVTNMLIYQPGFSRLQVTVDHKYGRVVICPSLHQIKLAHHFVAKFPHAVDV